jgi:hypothetical protein
MSTKRKPTYIDALVNEVNINLGLPTTAYIKDENGKTTARIGHIYAEKGLNGYHLLQIVNAGGGVTVLGTYKRQTKGSMEHTLLALANVTRQVGDRLGKTPFDWAV